MKKYTLIFITFFVFQAWAQKPQPKSWTMSSIENVKPIRLAEPNLKSLRAEDAINDKDKSIPWRFGYDQYVDFGLNNAGKWQDLPNGDRIWRINFVSPGALSMNLIFNEYHLPVGGKLYVYNDDRSEILNVFTHLHNSPEEILGTWMVSGERVWIEYFEPKKAIGLGRINIGNVIHGYRTLSVQDESSNNPKALNDSGPCNIDVNCDISIASPLANDIKNDVKKSVGMIVVGGNGICTGALINNTNNDGTPYFLTANHCLGGSVSGWAFRFNWASDEAVADCATNAPSVDNGFIQTASGAILRASNSESDMALLEITDAAFFNSDPDVVWAGWNRSKSAVPSLNVGVHHPSGDIQKVCVDFQGATRSVTDFNGNPTTEVWRIADWDLGVTEQGSSGSPLFDQDGLIIGKLSGGSAACSGTNDNGGFDVYGRFGVSWDFSSVNSEQLQFWLDPVGSNPVDLEQFPPLEVFDFDAAITLRDIPANLCEETIEPTIRITNVGTIELTSATITYQLDANAVETINYIGNLALDEFEDIPLSAIAVSGVGNHEFTATVSNPNGNADQSNSNNISTKPFAIPEEFETSIIRVIITPDGYGEETTWRITNSANIVIATGGPYTTTGNNETQPDEVTDVAVTDFGECYTFTIDDSVGDGICCGFGNGTYRLEDGDNNTLINGNGNFGSSASNVLRINEVLSTNQNSPEQTLEIYPNPSSTNFTVNINNFNNMSYTISNILGQRIKTGMFNDGLNLLPMQTEPSGLYFIEIKDNASNFITVKKIIKQ